MRLENHVAGAQANQADPRSSTEAAEALSALRDLFAFGVPGGRSRIQKRIGKFLDGDDSALNGAPTIKAVIERGVAKAKAIR